MDLLQELSYRVENGQRFYVNFYNRTLKVGGEYLILNGVVSEGYDFHIVKDEVLNEVERLYGEYVNSVPSERSERKRNVYFKAKDYEELDDEDLIFGFSREVAQARLEGYLLCAILDGFTWDESFGSWYWKSKKYKDLVILREWIDKQEKYDNNNIVA